MAQPFLEQAFQGQVIMAISRKIIRTPTMPRLAMCALPVAAAMLAGAGPAQEFTVAVSGLRSASGNVVVCLWRDRAGFPDCTKSSTAVRVTERVSARTMRVAVPAPTWANAVVTVHHDEDGNGRLKTNFIGMPKEGVGISNNRGGMPSYNRAVLPIAPGSVVPISIKYL